MIDEILQYKCLVEQPPLLVDVGASGDIHCVWKKIAKYSICIAFDADERELDIVKQTGGDFKEFYMINRVVSDKSTHLPFYLTDSPFCSSSLRSRLNSLDNYHLRDNFKIKKTIELPSITIKESLDEIGYDYIDWFKTDSQGTDLRIFSVLDNSIADRVLVAEFEPGIMDAYEGEDKLWKLMSYFESKDFWSDECHIKGMSRLSPKVIEKEFNNLEKRFIPLFQKNNAFWAEISYMNTMEEKFLSERDFLLMIVFAILKKQFGFVLEISESAYNRFNNPIFNEIYAYCLKRMKYDGYKKIPMNILLRLYSRCFKS